ncbi:DUF6414 family protein [Streptococcus mutans]|uniref:DUF6414 family protein n=1 Tax=Streptococcus mutans TaxID=1309 RepID=UPI0028EF2274|nr:DUF6414 family protein [Streptococcus mutans]MDT9539527.1 DUF6414 family protein [Streptococcus mutans]
MENIKKVIYFDESTTIDFLQIETKGKLTKTTELMTAQDGNIEAEASAEVKVGKNSAVKAIFEKFTGISGSAELSVSGNGNIQGEKIAKTILENTLLYDFLDTVEFRKKKHLVDITQDYTLEISENSMSYFAMIAPISEMMEGSQNIDGMDNVSMSFSKLNSGIRSIKGYFELLGYNNEHKLERIFRFNIDSFKNNYRIQDLIKMNLCLYSLKVGTASIDDLAFESQFNLNKNQLSFSGLQDKESKEDFNKKYPVYDVILAGVK